MIYVDLVYVAVAVAFDLVYAVHDVVVAFDLVYGVVLV